METSQANLKVSFYLKKNVSRNGLSPVMGCITIGKDMAQFSCKLEADPNLWDTRAGRMNGKSAHAHKVNSEIDKINVAVNAQGTERSERQFLLDLVSVSKADYLVTGNKTLLTLHPFETTAILSPSDFEKVLAGKYVP